MTPSFIHELKLQKSPKQFHCLNKRLEVARQIYNACLGESLKRHRRMRESKSYQRALLMSKGTKERRIQFQESEKTHQFREYDLHFYVKGLCKNTWLSEHIDAATAQKLATRAFQAVKEYALGNRGKPRFRSKNRFSSIESKSNRAGIRFVDGKICWKGLVLGVIYDNKDKHGVESHALACRTKYVRLVRRYIKGRGCWFAQLVQEGIPHLKPNHTIGSGVVGLDIGPSTIAMAGETFAKLQPFCPEVQDYSIEIKKHQKRMARSLRATNSENFEPNVCKITSGKKIVKLGKPKKGRKHWVKSNRYSQIERKVAELERKKSESRKRSQGELVNDILILGKTIKTEKLSYKAFQKQFGKSVQNRAPGMFLEKLRTKAANAGGEVIEFPTRTTALSQVCQCGHRQKKALNMRWHHCVSCGVQAQRDLYSAYLARFVVGNRLDMSQACEAWAGGGMLLEQAISNLDQATIGKIRFASFGLNQSRSSSSVKEESIRHKALDVVA